MGVDIAKAALAAGRPHTSAQETNPLRSPSAFPSCPHAEAGMRWFRRFSAFLFNAALLTPSAAAEYRVVKITFNRAFNEFIRRPRWLAV
jgi:hypothetical protein